MNYKETLDYLFNALPMFQRVGASAFKKDLSNTIALCDHLGQPQRQFKSIHVAGTNGKGSTSHAICSVLMEAGYKVGLYTSPHLKSFTERIKINGKEIPEQAVIDFVAENQSFLNTLKPSFFEMTVGMAFWYFAKQNIDIAVVEVGMGGRLDSTNIIQPEVSVITNIGYDHMEFLGDTLEKIAREKAGIIKKHVPVVIGHRQQETTAVYEEIAGINQAPILFAEDSIQVIDHGETSENNRHFLIRSEKGNFDIKLDLMGAYQKKNLPAILKTITVLQSLNYKITEKQVFTGLENVIRNTGLKGRWQVLGKEPWIICDTGHNQDGIKEIIDQINQYTYNQLYMILGMVSDKDITKILKYLPKDARYIFCQANIPRALPVQDLLEKANEFDLKGICIEDVNEAISWAKKNANKKDFIFVGGSTFVVAEINGL